MGTTLRFTIEQVKETINKSGDILLSTEYKNYRQKLKIKCHKCDEEYEQSFQMILKGYFCTKTCRSENYTNRNNANNNPRKYTIEEVKRIVDETDYTLCSKEYKNGTSKLDIYCNTCKTVFKMPFYHFNIDVQIVIYKPESYLKIHSKSMLKVEVTLLSANTLIPEVRLR